MTWTSLYLPLAKGLDLSKEAQLGGDELHTALNVDFGPDGSIKGRPARAAADQFYVLDPVYSYVYEPTYLSAQTFAATGLTPAGLVRLRDRSGERPALATYGRLFVHEGSKWHDRGAFGCMRVDRMASLPLPTVTTDPATSRHVMAPDFGHVKYGIVGPPAESEQWAFLSSTGAVEQRVLTTGGGVAYPGTGCRQGSTTAALAINGANKLNLFVKRNGALTKYQLAANARNPSDIGDAPVICPSNDGSYFYVVYRTTGANEFSVLKVNVLGGSVVWTYTSTQSGLQGIWIDHTAGTHPFVAFTHSGGLTLRAIHATTGAVTGSDADDSTGQGYDCVVGIENSGKAWWAYRQGSADEDLIVGRADLSLRTTSILRIFRGVHSSAFTNAGLRWSVCHQPVKMGGRMYLTLCCSSALGYVGTWLTVDLTNWWTGATTATGPFPNPTIVARGPTSGTYPHKQPVPASVSTDGLSFVFATQDWQAFARNEFSNLTGTQASLGLNQVAFSKPRAALLGETTVFSGSVPRMVARGDCVELGFPFLGGEPGLEVEAVAGGSIPAGDYTVQACWRWTDEAGQIHRSGPSPARTVTVTGGGAQTIKAHATNPWLTDKASRVVTEYYVNSLSTTSSHYLQTTSTWQGFSSEPTSTATMTTLLDTTETLYTDGGVLGNYHVPGDGGVTAVGRRMWLASADKVFATKLWSAGKGPEFNDDAAQDQPSLYVNLPAGAGRAIALENLDDKLVVFCERGVYLIQDGGPDNLGLGADFAPPLRISDLSIAGPRSSCTTDAGVLFCSTLDTVDAARGGPWLIDRQFTFTDRQYLGRQAQDYHLRTSGWVPEVAYSSERQQAFITTNRADGATSNGVVVIDMRVGKWAVWDTYSATLGALQSVVCVSGALVVHNTEPAAYSATPGTDAVYGNYPMVVRTSALSADGRDGLGWARVRAVSPHSADGAASHVLTMTAYLDGPRTALSSGAITQTTGSEATWPSSRLDPEWRLPIQKCSTIAVQLSATPATARWAAIRLDVAPLPSRAPAKTRS
jgi:hypothetical protein